MKARGRQKKITFIECFTCGKKGHKSSECFKIKSGVVSVNQLHIQIIHVENQKIKQIKHLVLKMSIPMHLN